jgi:predicted kinase
MFKFIGMNRWHGIFLFFISAQSFVSRRIILRFFESSPQLKSDQQILRIEPTDLVVDGADNNFDLLSRLIELDEQLVIILVGIPGCGKSTFTSKVLKGSRNRKKSCRRWVAFNQDVLKTRKRVESETNYHLKKSCNVIIDRCNFDRNQRATWITLAKKYNAKAVCVVFPLHDNVRLCAKRATLRGNDGIHDADTDWFEVCQRISRQFVYPHIDEGMNLIINCSTYDDIKRVISICNLNCKEATMMKSDTVHIGDT